MARARNIKPGFFKNEVLAELPYEVRLLFIGLWTYADKAGRFEYRTKRIKAELFPYDDVDIDGGIGRLQDAGFLVIYEDSDSSVYVQIVNWDKHQRPHYKETDSEIPSPEAVDDKWVPVVESTSAQTRPDVDSTLNQAQPDVGSTSHADTGYRIPDSGLRIPDTGSSDSAHSGENRKRKPVTSDDLDYPPSIDTPSVRQAVGEWLSYKRSRGESYKQPRHMNAKLEEFAACSPESFIEAVQFSIGNNYAGLFAGKSRGSPPKPAADKFAGNRKFLERYMNASDSIQPIDGSIDGNGGQALLG